MDGAVGGVQISNDLGIIDTNAENSNLSPAEQRKLEKVERSHQKKKEKWKVFVDFLLRHMSIVTTKYVAWEKEEFEQFKDALEKAQRLDQKESNVAAKTYKKLKERSDLLATRRFYGESNKIKKYIDLIARLRGLNLIARDFYKSIKKGKVEPLENILNHLQYWKGFTGKTFDIGELNPKGVDMKHPGMKYVMWLCLVRTLLSLGQKFLQCASELTEIPLVSASVYVRFNLTEEQMTVCLRLEDILATHVTKATGVQTSDFGKRSSLNFSGLASGLEVLKRRNSGGKNVMQLPGESDHLTFELPPEPPKEKKKKKKGKKGKKGSAKKRKKK
ncbi:unnamed protein product [Clavelina lepadiformis]|uniref:Uncharacterized protein n=1 Tax=Clavelina lepadiformis TaxID=159417 RepID=A0ABP0GI83_CLALP